MATQNSESFSIIIQLIETNIGGNQAKGNWITKEDEGKKRSPENKKDSQAEKIGAMMGTICGPIHQKRSSHQSQGE